MTPRLNKLLSDSVHEGTPPKHTPGPWTAHFAKWTPDSELFGFTIDAPGRIRPLASAGVYEGKSLIIDESYSNVAPGYFSSDEVEANANLLAAAPDLLAACIAANKHLADMADSGGPKAGMEGIEEWSAVQQRLFAAITKATGGTNA